MTPRLCLDIDAVSLNARSEKSARQGHISTLGFWFARRPTGLCRALILAAGTDMRKVSSDKKLTEKLLARYDSAENTNEALSRLSGELSHWMAFEDDELMSIARAVLRRSGVRTLVDPFGGGGSIPLEASRLGLDVGTGDLNPAAVILLRVMLEVLPAATEEVLAAFDRVVDATLAWLSRESGQWFEEPGSESISAVLWAWNMNCPSCGDTFPLISNPLLSDQEALATGLARSGDRWVSELVPRSGGTSTVARGKAVCPGCGSEFGSDVLMTARRLGRMSEVPYAIVTRVDDQKRSYSTEPAMLASVKAVASAEGSPREFDLPLDTAGIRHLWAMAYGVESVADVFSPRQLVQLSSTMEHLREEARREGQHLEAADQMALDALVALVAVRLSLYNSRHSWWQGKGEFPAQTFVRQALSMVWNYCEIPPSSRYAGGLASSASWVRSAARPLVGGKQTSSAAVWCGPADQQPLESSSVDLIVTDPPYFDSITYAYLSDIFYPVYRFMLRDAPGWMDLVKEESSPREREAIVDRPHKSLDEVKTGQHFQEVMTASFAECRRILKGQGSLVVMYGHKTEEAWEALLTSIAVAGFQVVDALELVSERGAKFQHGKVNHLEDSVALICRPAKGKQATIPPTLEEVRGMVERNAPPK